MAAVINGILTSPANAGSMLKGDRLMFWGTQITISGHPSRSVESDSVFLPMGDAGVWMPINQPVPRVIGARAGGVI